MISTIPNNHQISQDLYLSRDIYSRIVADFKNTGLLNISLIAEEIHQSQELIKQELVPILYPSKEGWYNSQNEYITVQFILDKINTQIHQYNVISIEKLLSQIGNPNIDFNIPKKLIDDQYQGKWLEDINVFIEMTEFQNLTQNSTRIDESRVSHLLTQIDLEFSRFLQSLQTIMDVKTYRTTDGQLITLEDLHPQLQQRIIGKGYVNIPEFLGEMKLEPSIEALKPVILDYITQEFSGRTTPETDYFFVEDLISNVTSEIEALSRVNFDVLAFKLDLDPNILILIVKQVLFIRGFTNTMGEYVTSKGIYREIQEILEFREEFSLQELYEILEIDEKNKVIVRDIISEDNNLLYSENASMVMTQNFAVKKVIDYIKKPAQQSKELILWEDVIQNTFVPLSHIKSILESMIQNNLLLGTLQKKGYRP
ncbi:MAG: hypothetical protein ACXACR_14360 [Candidatus Hodarchaeales archaeon]|jgi:hypothetical protein